MYGDYDDPYEIEKRKQEKIARVFELRQKGYNNLAKLIPEGKKDMNDLKRDRRKRTL